MLFRSRRKTALLEAHIIRVIKADSLGFEPIEEGARGLETRGLTRPFQLFRESSHDSTFGRNSTFLKLVGLEAG